MARDDGIPPAAQTEELISHFSSPLIKDNPYNFVNFVFPWGQKNTPLEGFHGPKQWQKEELLKIAAAVEENKKKYLRKETPDVYQLSVCSGRGPGKSALLAWLALWQMSTRIGSATVVVANTQEQLASRVFAEIGFWFGMLPNKYWFEKLQTSIIFKPWFAETMGRSDQLSLDAQYAYIKGFLWSDDGESSFAGVHNPRGTMVLFDEASGIPDHIWKVSKGFFAMISLYRFWCVFSNPRSNTGSFFETFHKNREFWNTRVIDSRTVEGLDKKLFASIIAENGLDSDETRIEVLGEFPRQGDFQFISRSIVTDAVDRKLDRMDDHAALVMGVDVARYGDDTTCIRFRQGRDARSFPPIILKRFSNMQVANQVADLITKHNPAAVFVDAGAGAGVIDRLREMGYTILEVNFGSKSEDSRYADHRTELWARMRDWFPGGMIPNERKLIDDCCGPMYEITGRSDRLKLESKEKMKKRGLASPDNADALAITFHAKVPGKMTTLSKSHRRTLRRAPYKPFGG